MQFDEHMEDLDNRLAAIACNAFEVCSSVDARFKVRPGSICSNRS